MNEYKRNTHFFLPARIINNTTGEWKLISKTELRRADDDVAFAPVVCLLLMSKFTGEWSL